MTLQLLHANWLWLLLPAMLLLVAALWRLRDEEPGRIAVIIAVRGVLLATVIALLAQPMLARERDDVAVVAVIDVSGSVRQLAAAVALRASEPPPLARLRPWLETALDTRGADDRFGLLVFDRAQSVLATPARRGLLDDSFDRPMAAGTDIASALQLARAIFPPDASRRVVLISDGNQTVGDAIEAALAAAADPQGSVPIDVLPIAFRLDDEVQVLRVETPTAARTGQRIAVRIMLESTRETTGRLTLTREGELIDLDPGSTATSRRIVVPRGVSVHEATVAVDGRPLHRLAAIFEPDDPAHDTLGENNRGEAVVTNAGANAVLLVRGAGRRGIRSSAESLLVAAAMPVHVIGPDELPDDLLMLQAFDLVILDDVGANEVEFERQALLAEYVDRLGGGLIVTGGPNSFGAGGWRGSPLEAVLPVSLDVPRQLQRPVAALVLVLDKSGSMGFPVAGARTTQQEIANEAAVLAVESLGARSLVGVIAFDHSASIVVPLAPNDDPQEIVRRIRGINAAGGTDIAAGLAAAEQMLEGVDVERRQIVFLTDGRSRAGQPELIAERLAAGGARLTTIGVGDDIDVDGLRELAEIGGGDFHMVRNPRSLPRVLVDSVRLVNRPLVREEPFTPIVQATGTGLLAGAGDPPLLRGLVLTTRRPTPDAVIELLSPTDEPVLATWQAGLGRVAAFTSDLDGPWAADWLDWPGWNRLWTELARRTARPALGAGLTTEITVVAEGLAIRVEVEEDADSSIDPAQLGLEGLLYAPDGRRTPIRLRQTAARRFEATVPTDAEGTHIVVLSPRLGDRPLAPLVAAATRPPAEEYRASVSNIALLREIAERTGGRLLDWNEPTALPVFDRTGLTPTTALRPLWPILGWLALTLLLTDVAVRRVAWSPARVRSFVAGAVRRGSRLDAGSTSGALAAARARTVRSPDERPAPPQTSAPLQVPRQSRPQSPLQSTVQPPLQTRVGRQDPAARDAALRNFTGESSPSPSGSQRGGQVLSDDDRPGMPAQPSNEAESPEGAGQHGAAKDAMARLMRAKRRATGADPSGSDDPPPPESRG